MKLKAVVQRGCLVEFKSEIEGTIKKVMVKTGDSVACDQLLVEFF